MRYTIHKSPSPGETSKHNEMSEQLTQLMDQEILQLSKKKKQLKKSFSAYKLLFLARKKDGGDRPVIDLKKFNTLIPYDHFKMEGLHCLTFFLEQNDFLCIQQTIIEI